VNATISGGVVAANGELVQIHFSTHQRVWFSTAARGRPRPFDFGGGFAPT